MCGTGKVLPHHSHHLSIFWVEGLLLLPEAAINSAPQQMNFYHPPACALLFF
jgi:hypothetical protein